MVKLLRRPGTIAFEVEQQPASCPAQTFYLPRADVASVNEFASIDAALQANGFFVQYHAEVLRSQGNLAALLAATKHWAEEIETPGQLLAVAVMNSASSADFVLKRRDDWHHIPLGTGWAMAHMADFAITGGDGGKIRGFSGDSQQLELGQFYVRRKEGVAEFVRSSVLRLDLRFGFLVAEFKIAGDFFAAVNVNQPFMGAVGLEEYPDQAYIRSSLIPVSIVDNSRLSNLSHPTTARFDLLDHGRHYAVGTEELARAYLSKRGLHPLGFTLESVSGGNPPLSALPFNARDTLGRQLIAELGPENQVLKFLPVKRTIFHDPAHPVAMQTALSGTAIVPTGSYPITPAQRNDTSALVQRRFKLGPSNAEFMEIDESSTRANVSLNFFDQLQFGTPPAAFLVRTLVRYARGYASPTELARLQEMDPLSSEAKTVWASFALLDDNLKPMPEPEELGTPLRLRYSVQPDALVRFGVPTSAMLTPVSGSGRFKGTLDFEKSIARLPGPIPFTFLGGMPAGTLGHLGGRGEMESYLAEQRSLLRKRTGQILRAGDVGSAAMQVTVTPQGFEYIVEKGFPVYTLAKTDPAEHQPQVAQFEFKVRVNDDRLVDLFHRGEFFLVIPTTQIGEAKSTNPNINPNGICFGARLQLAEWGFDLAFDLGPPPASAPSTGAKPANNRSIVILKYKRGRLRDLLKDDKEWTNWGLLLDAWRVGALSAVQEWTAKIDAAAAGDRGFAVIKKILDDEKWTGVLLVNPVVDIGAFPPALQSIVPGIDLALFRANHVGFTQNKIEVKSVPNSPPVPGIKKSSLFGLIDYHDETGFPDPDKFAFRVHSLQVLFGNSEVTDFRCLLKIRLPSWFDDRVDEVKGGAPVAPSRPPRNPVDQEQSVFAIRGQYQSFVDASGRKINRYSFIHDKDIVLVQNNHPIFKQAVIDRVELRTNEIKGGESELDIKTELLLDGRIEFRQGLGGVLDGLGFDRLEITGVSVPFLAKIRRHGNNSWSFLPVEWVPKLTFGGVSLGTDAHRRRPDSLLSKFPLKFRAFRFFDQVKALDDLEFLTVFPPRQGGAAFKFGLEWEVDFGALAKLLGLDADLKGLMLTGWSPRQNGGGFVLGLSFPGMGGRRLDLSIGSVLRLECGYFDVFDTKVSETTQYYMVASDLAVRVNGNRLPKPGGGFGLMFLPDPSNPMGGPLGWLTTVKAEKLGFIDSFVLSLGQNVEYIGPATTPSAIIERIKALQSFALEPGEKDVKTKSEEFRKQMANTFKYNAANDWFIGLAGSVANIIQAFALYNPPGLFGGEVNLIDFLRISILYKQETPRVGVYTGTLTLAPGLRSMDFGGFRVQLPQIVVKFDTDGGYAIIIGLNLEKPDDFSNAAGAEIGIFKGDAAIMYARIHGSALRDVPMLAHPSFPEVRGQPVFTPVSQIMFAFRLGLGRTFEVLIFKGGASITIYGILSGMWGNLNIDHLSGLSDSRKRQLLDAMKADGMPHNYNKFWGEIGVIGEIFGVVDFGITRQRLTARLLIGLGVVFEMWRNTKAYLRGELRIELEWIIARFKIFGKSFVVRITLRFNTDFYEEYTLVNNSNEPKFDKWFVRGGPFIASSTPMLPSVLSAGQLPDWTRVPPAPAPGARLDMPVLITLDLTLDDAGGPRLVPLAFIPFAPGGSADDPGAFRALLGLIFNWSLLAILGRIPGDTDTVSADDVLGMSELIARERFAGGRGSWAAKSAWNVLAANFKFSLVGTLPSSVPGGTAILLPEGFRVTISKTGQPDEIVQLGNVNVNDKYLDQLSWFFDELRIRTAEEVGSSGQLSVVAGRGTRPLTEFLFEEYTESLLRSVWSRLAGVASDQRIARKWTPGVPTTFGELRRIAATEAFAVSGMINRQLFSGSRLPLDPAQRRGATQPMFSAANLTIDVSSWAKQQVNAISLTHVSVPGSEVKFADEINLGIIEELKKTKPVFGRVDIVQVKPFRQVDGEKHPLVDEVALIDANGTRRLGTVWSVPEMLAAKTYNRKFPIGSLLSHQELGVRLRRFQEKEVGDSQQTPDVDFRPLVLIALPVQSVPETGGEAFEIRQMLESDRRLLDDCLSTTSGVVGCRLEFFDIKEDEGGQVAQYSGASLDLANSFIGRINLSTDPNPTEAAIGRLAAAQAGSLLLRARPVEAERSRFLELIALAATTNSGGYVLRLKGWKNPAARRIMLALYLDDARFQGTIPTFANRIFTAAAPGQGAGHASDSLLLCEIEPEFVPVGEPGVIVAEVHRTSPSKLYHAPGMQHTARILTRDEALAQLVQASGEHLETLQKRDLLGDLASEILDAAGGREVDLAQRFNLLQMKIVANSDYSEFPMEADLPTGPKTDGRKNESGGQSSDYTYSWSAPAHRLVKVARNDLLPVKDEPLVYGAMLQSMVVSAAFRDVFGFSPFAAVAQNDLIPRYFDPLITPMNLSGLTVHHRVTDKGYLEVHMNFAPGQLVGGSTNWMDEETKQRLQSIRAAYTRALHQVRDANTQITIESTLGTPNIDGSPGGALRRPLTAAERKTLYDNLGRARALIDQMIGGTLVKPEALASLSFKQVGMVPASSVARYRVCLCYSRDAKNVWPDIAAHTRSRARANDSAIPLGGQRPQELAAVIKKAFPALRLTYTRDGRNEESYNIIDARVVQVSLKTGHRRPAFASIRPLSTRPYAKSEAMIWNWALARGRPQPGQEHWKRGPVVDLDLDGAAIELMRDIDRALSPSAATLAWASAGPWDAGEGERSMLDRLLATKNSLADAAASRCIPILQRTDPAYQNDDAVVDGAQPAVRRNLANSFKKRLSNIADVDTILAAPLVYPELSPQGNFLLYGQMTTAKLPGNAGAPDKSIAHFLPTALEREGRSGTLVIQFDAARAAAQEIYELPLIFEITHIRWDLDGGSTPYGARWLTLFDKEVVSLSVKPDGSRGPVSIPVLFKKLLKKPEISTASPEIAVIKPGTGAAEAVAQARRWTFNFDVERSRAATQDDLFLTVDYNARPSSMNRSLNLAAQRELGEVLQEYLEYRKTLETAGNRGLYLDALAYWGDYLAHAFDPAQPAPMLALDGGPAIVRHELRLDEAFDRANNVLWLSLSKEGSWPEAGLEFGLTAITNEKSALPFALVSDPIAGAATAPLVRKSVPAPSQSVSPEGEYYAGRRVSIKKLDILNFENARAGALIRRNASLGTAAGGPLYSRIREEFVYTTEQVRTGDPFVPLLEIDEAIILTGRTAREALAALLTAVFLGLANAADYPLIDLLWGYDSGQLDAYKGVDASIRIYRESPIAMMEARQPLANFKDELDLIEGSLAAWEKINGGRPKGGRYVFQLRVFSRLERVEKPLLIFRNLQYAL